MSVSRRPIVAVLGAREASDELLNAAEELGCCLVDAGYRVLSGGRGGVMEAVSRGGRRSGEWSEGRIMAIVPSEDSCEANAFVDIVIPSGPYTLESKEMWMPNAVHRKVEDHAH